MTDPATIASTLSRLPAFAGPTWRAADSEIESPFALQVPLATTRSLRVATRNFTVLGVHLFLSAEGRDVSMFSARASDEEIVLLPGATFAPATKFVDIGGFRVQVLLGIPDVGERTLPLPTEDTLVAYIEAARQTPVVSVESPGRFGP